MKLFSCPDAVAATVAEPAVIRTPLGGVRLSVEIGGAVPTERPPTATFRLPAGAHVACWHHAAFDLELVVCRPAFPSEEGMEVSDCWAGLWRLRANSPLPPAVFAATWDAGYAWTRGDTNSGQYLYAWEWDDRRTNVAVGTEDEDRLALRAQRGDGLPSEWEAYFRGDRGYRGDQTRHVLHGRALATPVPALVAGQACQLHFAAAWKPYERRSVAESIAVDRTGDEILAGVPGCS